MPELPDPKLYAIEELKLMQGLILKQESYAYTAYRYAFLIITGLVLGLFSGNINLGVAWFIGFSIVVFLGFLWLQLVYRESFFGAVGRSHYLQEFIGDRLGSSEKADAFKPFLIYESVHHLWPSLKACREAVRNPRFYVPNLLLVLLIISSAVIRAGAP